MKRTRHEGGLEPNEQGTTRHVRFIGQDEQRTRRTTLANEQGTTDSRNESTSSNKQQQQGILKKNQAYAGTSNGSSLSQAQSLTRRSVIGIDNDKDDVGNDHFETLDNDDDDDNEVPLGVDISYEEGNAISKIDVQNVKRKKRQRREEGESSNNLTNDEEDEALFERVPGTKKVRGGVMGEEAIDSTYSLLTEFNNNKKRAAGGDDEQQQKSGKAAADYPIEAFNMEDERTSGEGYFDGDTYVFRDAARRRGRNNDDDGEEDAWLESLQEEEEQQKQTKRSHSVGTNKENDSSDDYESSTNDHLSDDDEHDLNDTKGPRSKTNMQNDSSKESLLSQLIDLLASPDETVSGAMRRLGKLMGKNTSKSLKLPPSTNNKTSASNGATTTTKTGSRPSSLQQQPRRRNSDNNVGSSSSSSSEGTNGGKEAGKKSPLPTTKSASSSCKGSPPPTQQQQQPQKSTTSSTASDHLQRLTALTNALLLQHGEHDIYQKTKQQLLEMIPPLPSMETTANKSYIVDGPTSTSTAQPSSTKSYFVEETTNTNQTDAALDSTKKPTSTQWEYIGQVDQTIHGPYTTEQMIQWTSAGYFVGPSSVKIRLIKTNVEEEDPKKSAEDVTTTVDDLMADLEDSDDDDEEEENKKTGQQNGSASAEKQDAHKAPTVDHSPWMMSDQVDFKSYL